eukprot:TRINITY_DN63777_c0_g1_i1.p1 TRINITY_DN63777_c0_g1~~TRINITY_DN63777_c0_g1_i1.p1  ORF type:complete len:347 (+),score=32.25 TRINITY_DN63777_c0_g1_i1:37-1077(+)
MATAAACVLPCGETFDATLAFFTELPGSTLFAIDEIFPADSPREATISGQDLTLHLTSEGGKEERPGSGVRLQLVATTPDQAFTSEVAPNGTTVQWVARDRSNQWKTIDSSVRSQPVPLALPPLVAPNTLILSHASEDSFGTGRAGMLYRDLVPCRLGGALIAFAIKIPSGGPVPDYVHFHLVRFQMIYCVAGWVRVVYEGQGQPFLLHAGDLVLQPPTIRHRVLESSDGLEVLELGVPAEHITRADRNCTLPESVGTNMIRKQTRGQRFAHSARKCMEDNAFVGLWQAQGSLSGTLMVHPLDSTGFQQALVLPQMVSLRFGLARRLRVQRNRTFANSRMTSYSHE